MAAGDAAGGHDRDSSAGDLDSPTSRNDHDLANPPASLDRPTSLDDLVAYQVGAVVSRTIVKKPTGTVTAFAFDQGEGLSEHAAAFDALALVTDGQAEITVDGAAHLVTAGQMLRLPGGKPHALLALTRFKMLLVMIRE